MKTKKSVNMQHESQCTSNIEKIKYNNKYSIIVSS